MMRLRLPRKIQLFLIALVIVLNVVCFFTIGHVAIAKQLARLTNEYSDNSSHPSWETTASDTPTTQIPVTLNPKTKLKVDQMKLYLNESIQTNDTYPPLKIGNYLMSNPKLCQDVDEVDVVILVHTAPKNLDKRQRMRDSFAKDSLFYPFHVRIVFLLGRTKDETLQRQLLLEHGSNRDSVMGDFIDDYHNLTLKGVMGYRWVSEFCTNSKYILKIDDDVLVNMYKLLYSFTGHMRGKEKSIFCNTWVKSSMMILRKGKWRVPEQIFRNMNAFPYDYCSGFIVLISSDLIKPMYEAAKITPFFWIDDVYLFGMLPNVVGGVTFYNYALDKNVTLDDKKAMKCTQEMGAKCPIFATIIGRDSYWSYWKMIQELYSPSSWNVDKKFVE